MSAAEPFSRRSISLGGIALATFVLAFLSALATPIVRRLEIWQPSADGARLQLAEGFCETDGELKPGASANGIAPGEGLIGAVWTDAVPRVGEEAALAALPVLRDGHVVAVIGWYF